MRLIAITGVTWTGLQYRKLPVSVCIRVFIMRVGRFAARSIRSLYALNVGAPGTTHPFCASFRGHAVLGLVGQSALQGLPTRAAPSSSAACRSGNTAPTPPFQAPLFRVSPVWPLAPVVLQIQTGSRVRREGGGAGARSACDARVEAGAYMARISTAIESSVLSTTAVREMKEKFGYLHRQRAPLLVVGDCRAGSVTSCTQARASARDHCVRVYRPRDGPHLSSAHVCRLPAPSNSSSLGATSPHPQPEPLGPCRS